MKAEDRVSKDKVSKLQKNWGAGELRRDLLTKVHFEVILWRVRRLVGARGSCKESGHTGLASGSAFARRLRHRR